MSVRGGYAAGAAFAALGLLLLLSVPAAAQAAVPESKGGRLPLRWEIPAAEAAEPPLLHDEAGRAVPWAVEPEYSPERGAWLLRPPLLPDGRYVLSLDGEDRHLTQGVPVLAVRTDASTALRVAAVAGLASAFLLRRRRAAFLALLGSGGLLLLAGIAERPDLDGLDSCRYQLGAEEYAECVRRSSAEFFSAGGNPGDILGRLQELHPVSVWGPEPCHAGAHEAGEVWQELNGTAALGPDALACEMGFMHGVQASAAVGDSSSVLPERSAAACQDVLSALGERAWRECLHGRGHAMMVRSGGDLDLAMQFCERLPDPEELCRMGVIMEWQLLWRRAGGEEAVQPLPDLMPHQICMQRSGVNLNVCLLDAFFTYSSLPEDQRPATVAEIVTECLLLDDLGAVRACGNGVGALLVAGKGLEAISELVAECGALSGGRSSFEAGCLFAAHRVWLDGSTPALIRAACESTGRPLACLRALEEMLEVRAAGRTA